MAESSSDASSLKNFYLPTYILKPDADVEKNVDPPVCPVLVFINSKSGGQLGGDLLVTYRSILNPYQVFDLGQEAPDKSLQRIYANLEKLKHRGDAFALKVNEKLKIIVAGGDGTAGWLLGVVNDLKLSHPPAIATVPLGTGNNLPFAFGWGKRNPGTDRQSVQAFLKQVLQAKEMKIDNWHILMRMKAPTEGACDPIAPLELPHSLHAFHRVSSTDELNVEGYHTFRGGFWNYFSLGMDAQISYAFHSERKLHPEKFKNQLVNQSTYVKLGLHNIAIAEFFRDGCSNPRRLIEVLNSVKKKSEELALASSEQVEASSSPGNKASTKGSSSVPENQISAASNTSIFHVDEFDHSVAILNMAVIWFHLSEYAKALSILEPMYSKIQPIDETIALHICHLLLDVALACNDIAKSADVLNYLEKPLENGAALQQQSPNMFVKSSSIPSNSSVSDNSDIGNGAGLNTSDKSLVRTLSDETLEYESMMSALDIGGHNLESSHDLSTSNNFSRSIFDKTVPSMDLKLKLQLYKVRFLLLSGNLKAAKREIKGAMGARGDSSIAIILKSQLEYSRGNHRKAIRLLMALDNRTEEAIASMFFNNLGCIYHELAKFHMASELFTKALRSSSAHRKEKPLKLSTLSHDKSRFISYNCGVQYLACRKPILAARCLLKAQHAFHNKPLFWFRFAECSLMASEMGLLKNGRDTLESSELKIYVIGKGKWRQLAIKSGRVRNELSPSSENIDLSICNNGLPRLSISLARVCLYNAMHILRSSESGLYSYSSPTPNSSKGNGSSEVSLSRSPNNKSLQGAKAKLSGMNLGGVQGTLNGDIKEQKAVASQELISSSLSIYEDATCRKDRIIKQAVFANLAFVELELENPMGALSSAQSLLQIPNCSRVFTFLGHMYAAEALCLLNRPMEASAHLSVYLAEDKNVRLPFTEEDFEQWRVVKNLECEESDGGGGSVSAHVSTMEESQILTFLKPEEARVALYVNLAARYAMDGELGMALELVNQALVISANSREALLTYVYINMALGNSQEALSKLKKLGHVRFLPFSAPIKSS